MIITRYGIVTTPICINCSAAPVLSLFPFRIVTVRRDGCDGSHCTIAMVAMVALVAMRTKHKITLNYMVVTRNPLRAITR